MEYTHQIGKVCIPINIAWNPGKAEARFCQQTRRAGDRPWRAWSRIPHLYFLSTFLQYSTTSTRPLGWKIKWNSNSHERERDIYIWRIVYPWGSVGENFIAWNAVSAAPAMDRLISTLGSNTTLNLVLTTTYVHRRRQEEIGDTLYIISLFLQYR